MNEYVILDAGHNINTAGKRSPDSSLREYEFNRDVAKKTMELLEKHGVRAEVIWTEHANSSKDLNERVKAVNSKNPDILVSFHANAAGGSGWYKGDDGFTWNKAHGWEIFCYSLNKASEGYKLAKSIRDASIPSLGLKDRGIKDGSHLYIVRNTDMPAVLIEHAFYTNEDECKKLKTQAFRKKCAEAATKGILDYFGIEWAPEEKHEYRQIVQNRFGFADDTMDYLEAYKYGNDLLKKLATKG